MNKQIKVDELPKDWLVLDYWVQSGPAEFVSISEIIDDSLHISYPKETFGIKHIELVAPNTKFWESKQLNEPAFIGLTGNIVEIDRNNMDKLVKIKNQGKDFFIYKVTKEK